VNTLLEGDLIELDDLTTITHEGGESNWQVPKFVELKTYLASNCYQLWEVGIWVNWGFTTCNHNPNHLRRRCQWWDHWKFLFSPKIIWRQGIQVWQNPSQFSPTNNQIELSLGRRWTTIHYHYPFSNIVWQILGKTCYNDKNIRIWHPTEIEFHWYQLKKPYSDSGFENPYFFQGTKNLIFNTSPIVFHSWICTRTNLQGFLLV
jgi:hypothetical protein